jgi:ADP-ribose pyrophosphatase YjhB (NUDIX family)
MLVEELQDDATRTVSENERLKVQMRRQKREVDQVHHHTYYYSY